VYIPYVPSKSGNYSFELLDKNATKGVGKHSRSFYINFECEFPIIAYH